jgi:hypothetical protein
VLERIWLERIRCVFWSLAVFQHHFFFKLDQQAVYPLAFLVLMGLVNLFVSCLRWYLQGKKGGLRKAL